MLNGGDPMGHKQKRQKALTVNQLLDLYLESPTFAKKAESTKYVDKGRIERHIRPLLGKQYADLLSPDSVRRAQNDITKGKTAANVKTKARGVAKVTGGKGTADKAVLVLRAAYSWAVSEGILKDNPFEALDTKGVGQLMSFAVEHGRKTRSGLKVGICGEQGGHPRSMRFCHYANLTYVSCSSPRVPIARLAAAHAKLLEGNYQP